MGRTNSSKQMRLSLMQHLHAKLLPMINTERPSMRHSEPENPTSPPSRPCLRPKLKSQHQVQLVQDVRRPSPTVLTDQREVLRPELVEERILDSAAVLLESG